MASLQFYFIKDKTQPVSTRAKIGKTPDPIRLAWECLHQLLFVLIIHPLSKNPFTKLLIMMKNINHFSCDKIKSRS